MRYIKEFKDIDWDDWDEEEKDPNNIFLTIKEILDSEHIIIEYDDVFKFMKLLDDNDIRWSSGDRTIQNNKMLYDMEELDRDSNRGYVVITMVFKYNIHEIINGDRGDFKNPLFLRIRGFDKVKSFRI